MGAIEFDYYIFIDYSENLIGYNIIEKLKIRDLLNKITKLKHYKEVKHKSKYLYAIKKQFDKCQLCSFFNAFKIKSVRQTLEIVSDIVDFVKKNNNLFIFISIDDKQYLNFEKLIGAFDGKNILIVKEGKLRRDSIEYKLSLIIDNLLNIERTKNERK